MNENQLATSNSIENEERISDHYLEFLESISSYFNLVLSKGVQLFTTDSDGLYEAYLCNLPQEARQHYTCAACRRFINRYGGLVTISDNGEIQSAIWNDSAVPEIFAPSVKAMKNIALKSIVNGVFLSENAILGRPITDSYHHMSVTMPSERVYHSKLIDASQAMSEKLEDFRVLKSGLLRYPIEAVEQAVTLLKTESLYRSEKCLGVAEWLKDIHIRHSKTKNSRFSENIIWLAAATAPIGYCHINSTMIGTLLDDIIKGLSFDLVSLRFAKKMHPLQYQRPQAAPTAGNIAQAEKIVEMLGIQKSLVRRFARLDELENIWISKEKKEQIKSGVFSHLEAKDKNELTKMDIPPITMTWRRFSETILPLAESIEFFVKNGKDNFSAILTACYEDAPAILQWDSEERRNPFSWYIYQGGSSYDSWRLSTGYCKVTGICLQPSMWYGDFSHQGKSVFFILEGAKDTGYKKAGSALFPEILKSELREIRSTIEAYSKSAKIENYDEASACGIKLEYGSNWDAMFRVTTNAGTGIYKLDRWD